MISRQDILLLLTDLQEQGIDVEEDIKNLYSSNNVSFSTLKKISESKPLDVINFYEKLRKSYNNNRSKLYINIMKSDENAKIDLNTVLTTLSALLNQILQFEAEDKTLFYKSVRADEISKVLTNYFTSYNIDLVYKLLKLIKADIYAFEYITGKRK